MQTCNLINIKWSRATAALYLIVATLLPSFSLALTPEQQILLDYYNKTGRTPEIVTQQGMTDGVVTSMTTKVCFSANSCKTIEYRNTRGTLPLDGKTLYVDATEGRNRDYQVNQNSRSGSGYSLINLKSSTTSNSTDGNQKLEVPDAVLEVTPQDSVLGDMLQLMPQLALGIVDNIQNMQNMAALSAQLQRQYQQAVNAFNKQQQGKVDNSNAYKKQTQSGTGAFNVMTAEKLLSPDRSSLNRSKEYQEYLKAAANPATFKEYEFSEQALNRVAKELNSALANRQPRKSIQLAETLLHQKDPTLRAKASKNWQPYFNDGVLRSRPMGAEDSIVDQMKFKTPLHSLGGAYVRKIANKAQIVAMESRNLTGMNDSQLASFVSALSALRSADSSYIAGFEAQGANLVQAADVMLNFTIGYVDGTLNNLQTTYAALPLLGSALADFGKLSISDPEAAFKQAGHVIAQIPEIADAMMVHYAELADQMAIGTPRKIGAAVGEVATEVIINYLTEGAVFAAKNAMGAGAAVVRGSRIYTVTSQVAQEALTEVGKLAGHMTAEQSHVVIELAKKGSPLALRITAGVRVLSMGTNSGKELFLKYATTGKRSAVIMMEAVERGVIKTSEQIQHIERLLPILDMLPTHVDIGKVGFTDKVAIIGRSMDGNVNTIKEILESKGISVETFSVSESAKAEFADLRDTFRGTQNIPHEQLLSSKGYAENYEWIKKMRNTGVTVLDAGDPMQKGYSLYYEMEKMVLREAL